MMMEVAEYPLLLFVTGTVVLWLAAQAGVVARGRHPLDEEMRLDFSVILGAALTLLALIIGFSFSAASTRYDLRKTLEEAEANAIGTEYVRTDLLPAVDAEKLRPLLKSYVSVRIQYYDETGAAKMGRRVDARTQQLQAQLWSVAIDAARANPTPVIALVVSGMNDVLNSQSYTQAAWWNRIPTSAWILMIGIAACCNFLVGYGMRSGSTTRRLLFIFPVLVSIAFSFIADIDSPRHGIIRVRPQNLIDLATSLADTSAH
jgi:hypothetical protein